MHIGIHTQYYTPEIGAPQARLSELANRFVARGHRVTVLTGMPNYPLGEVYPGYGGWFRREWVDGVEILRAPIFPVKSARFSLRMANYMSFVASSLAIGGATLPRVDYLMTESPPLFLGMSGYVLSRLRGTRWIFNVSDVWPGSVVRLGMITDGLALKAAFRLEEFCYRHSWLVTCQTKGIEDGIKTRFPSVDTYHLPNGVHTGLFSPDKRSEALRASLGVEGKVVAIYAGLHGKAQGLSVVLRAASLLKSVGDLVVLLVGDGPEKQELLQLQRSLGVENVRFLDPRPREEIATLLASADIGLVTLVAGFDDAVPSKLYEAMGSGLPIMLVAQGEAERLVGGAEAGRVTPPGDPEALAAELAKLVADKALRRQLGANARRSVEQAHSRKAIGDRFVDLLESQR